MYKVLIYSDPHWSQSSSILRKRGDKFSVRLNNLIESINWVEKLGTDNSVDEIICCGDFFDKPVLNAEEITALRELKFSNCKHKFIVGNHESNINTLIYSTTNVFENVGAEIINEYKIESINDKVDFTFIPYITGDVCDIKTFIKNSNKKNIIFAHQDIAGIQYGRFTSQIGFNIDDICNNCELMFNGHLHNGMTINEKIILVGNLTGQNFTEDSNLFKHNVFILTVNDDGTTNIDKFENPYAINFYKATINTKQDIKNLKFKQNSVVSFICKDTLKEDVVNYISKNSNIIEHRITVFYNNNTNNSTSIQPVKKGNHIEQFIELAQLKLEPSPLLTDELTRLGGDQY